eukprot:CAMPEP_0118943782 /NCGR_PEP_ID=MMETSP1169-20130426/39024_1 /TAXON_ID=36882 /ORGANISM="Pyramimonas obovata, Strain CCMP722" /LENGTH=385 /DNA_ID=CAMNT_0006889113 /DNA_START=132 /DNA_END=1286 /DNA_ORIENTATION=+
MFWRLSQALSVYIVLLSSCGSSVAAELYIPSLFSSSGSTAPARGVAACRPMLRRLLKARVANQHPFKAEYGALKEHSFEDTVNGATCAVVGNSGALLRPPFFGAAIDAHDVVMRLNQAPTENYATYVGEKTTHRLLNRLWGFRYSYGHAAKAGTGRARFIDAPREENVTLVASRIERDVFRELLRTNQEYKSVRSILLGRDLIRLSQDAIAWLRQCSRAYSEGGSVPSSGLTAIVLLLGMCKRLTVFGIGAAWTEPGRAQGWRRNNADPIPYQYYKWKHTERQDGNPTHSFEAERALVEAMAAEGMLHWCTPEGCKYGGSFLRTMTPLKGRPRKIHKPKFICNGPPHGREKLAVCDAQALSPPKPPKAPAKEEANGAGGAEDPTE